MPICNGCGELTETSTHPMLGELCEGCWKIAEKEYPKEADDESRH